MNSREIRLHGNFDFIENVRSDICEVIAILKAIMAKSRIRTERSGGFKEDERGFALGSS